MAESHRHFAIDARPGIPPRAVSARVAADGHHIGLAEPYVGSGIHAERHVAVVPPSGKPAVDIDLGKGHHSVEIEVHAPLAVGLARREGLAIPAHALPGELARVAIGCGIERAGDRPIVRQMDGLPRRVVEVGLFRTGGFPLNESPIAAEVQHLRRIVPPSGNGRRQRGQSQPQKPWHRLHCCFGHCFASATVTTCGQFRRNDPLSQLPSLLGSLIRNPVLFSGF